MAKRSFSPELLESLRSMAATKALDALGLHWKRDPDFQPVKDAATIRLHVAVGGQVFELLVTGAKFFDTRADKGGGGAIDLAMHLLRLDFVAAVKRLSSSRVSSVGVVDFKPSATAKPCRFRVSRVRSCRTGRVGRLGGLRP